MSEPAWLPLCVPPWEEQEALREGARYLANEHAFVVDKSAADLDKLWAWLPKKYDPWVDKPVLKPDMLPATTWGDNIRERLGESTWDRMRRHAYRAAGFRCRICGRPGLLEAHEQWELVNETTTQRLAGILALCPLCHKAHHLGFARRMGLEEQVHAHLMAVNNWNRTQLWSALQDLHETWEQRCEWPWTVDLSWLQENGYLFV